MSFCVCVVITTLTFTLAAPLASLGVEGETLTQSVEFIRFLSFFYLVFSLHSYLGVLQGAGDVLFTSLCTATSLFVRVTCSYTMAYVFDVGYSSVWKAVPVGWTICIMMVFIRFFGGKWQTKGIVKREVQTE